MPMKTKELQREYQRKWIAQRRANFFADKYCVWVLPDESLCGSQEKLELDHIDASNKINNSIWSWSEERRSKEIEKCQVLCHTHHLEKTHINRESARGSKHGNSKFTDELIREIRSKYARGNCTYRSLAKEYNTCFQNISDIITKRTWKEII